MTGNANLPKGNLCMYICTYISNVVIKTIVLKHMYMSMYLDWTDNMSPRLLSIFQNRLVYSLQTMELILTTYVCNHRVARNL